MPPTRPACESCRRPTRAAAIRAGLIPPCSAGHRPPAPRWAVARRPAARLPQADPYTPLTETRAHEMLQAAYEVGELSPFDFAAERWGAEADPLAGAKAAAVTPVTPRPAGDADDGPLPRTRVGSRDASVREPWACTTSCGAR